MKTDLPIAPITHIEKRVAKRARISLSSFFSNVLLLEGTFIEFIITFVSCPVNMTAPTMYSVLRRLHPRRSNWFGERGIVCLSTIRFPVNV